MTLPLHHWRTIADQATKACAGFDGRFFFDAEHGDLAYIASDCDRQECDCEHNLNSDGDQDCSISVGDIDESGEPIAVMLNALPAAITEIERLRQPHLDGCKGSGMATRPAVFSTIDEVVVVLEALRERTMAGDSALASADKMRPVFQAAIAWRTAIITDAVGKTRDILDAAIDTAIAGEKTP